MRLIDANTAEKNLAELVKLYEKRMPKWSPNDMLTSGRDAALKWGYKADGVEKALETIKDMPTVEAVPVKHGNYREVKMFPVFPRQRSSHRKPKHRPTRKVQERLNQVNAERALARLIAANFSSDDVKLELTYSPANYHDSIEQSKRDIVNFFRRVKRARQRAGITAELKYIYAFGEGSIGKRIHFHVIMSGGLPIQQIAKIWGKGYVDKVAPLMFDEQGVTGIARYFAQQQSKIVDEYDEPMLVPDLKPRTKALGILAQLRKARAEEL